MDEKVKKIISKLENETGLKVEAIKRHKGPTRGQYELHFVTPKSDYVIYILFVAISSINHKWYVCEHALGNLIQDRFEEIVDDV